MMSKTSKPRESTGTRLEDGGWRIVLEYVIQKTGRNKNPKGAYTNNPNFCTTNNPKTGFQAIQKHVGSASLHARGSSIRRSEAPEDKDGAAARV